VAISHIPRTTKAAATTVRAIRMVPGYGIGRRDCEFILRERTFPPHAGQAALVLVFCRRFAYSGGTDL
jgi:hypothetical protein